MELNQDEAVVVKEDSDIIIWRGPRESALRVAEGMSQMNRGQRYSVMKMTAIATYRHDPAPARVIEFPARPPQPV